MDEKLVRMSDIERWILTESASIDTQADRDYVVERMRYSLPAVDAVEVVRCAECIHSDDGWLCDSQFHGGRTFPGDYCSNGERREENRKEGDAQ